MSLEFTVGIITYNRPGLLDDLLESLGRQTKRPDEVVIVDGSPDTETWAVVDERAPSLRSNGVDVRYLREESDTAQPGARNTIIDEASGDVICYVDDDTYCTEAWLETIANAFENEPGVASVGGPAVSTDEEYGRVFDQPIHEEHDGNRITRYREVRDVSSRWRPPRPVETDLLRGANMAVRTAVLERLGGFDTDYGIGPALFEETDVMVRLSRAGYRTIYHPDAVVYHVVASSGGTRDKLEEKTVYDNFYWLVRSNVLFKRKTIDSTCLYLVSLVRLLVRPPDRLEPSAVSTLVANELRSGSPGSILRYVRAWSRGVLDGIRG